MSGILPVILVVLSVAAGSVRSLGLSSCDGSATVKIKSLDLSPGEIHPGQDLLINAQWDVLGDVSKPVKAELKFSKSLGFFRIQVPCVNNIGSCTYENICRMAGSGELCNFSRGSHSASSVRFKIPHASTNVAGTYDMEVRLIDGSGRKLGCWSGRITVKQ
ncbi:hypothetical protein BV898_02945 [Hypsibius exemplaris]|uniref:MD-2-related lipid-recognition domain-containing protein n=1 Tax=Hypsibius exemplaris TaxID=2072580 RepID=A0A1W0X7C8_HYPEX|nr:hypothetical protein BV898_02945 [Hypsibius exemplaris]